MHVYSLIREVIMPKQILWLHEKALRDNHPAFDKLEKSAEVVHIWDDAYYKSRQYSFKRLVFIYETLTELPVDIYHGNTVDVIRDLGATEVIIPDAPDTQIQALIKKIQQVFRVTIVPEEPFVDVPQEADFKRFFKFWNKARKSAF